MKTTCAYCNEVIEDNGSIYKGKPYHNVCLTSAKIKEDQGRVSTLSQTFDEIDYHVLEVLFEPYACIPNGVSMLTEDLEQNWCIITEKLSSIVRGIDSISFKTKKEMLEWLASRIEDTMDEDFGWEVLYILNKGKLIKSVNQFNIKVSLCRKDLQFRKPA